ncbi:MAG TPA: hypothetical protein VFQ61_23935, partial [Polyangiaceae bacterium]|nr:hypothetical protein [Polyangiaceae bacterium]
AGGDAVGGVSDGARVTCWRMRGLAGAVGSWVCASGGVDGGRARCWARRAEEIGCLIGLIGGDESVQKNEFPCCVPGLFLARWEGWEAQDECFGVA